MAFMAIKTHANNRFHILKEVVEEMGGTIEKYIPERHCYYVTLQGKRFLIEQDIPINRQLFATALSTKRKDVTYKLLTDNGINSPYTTCFYRKDFCEKEAMKALEMMQYPVVIKQSSGSNSRGIYFSIETAKQALLVLQRGLPIYGSMIAQEMVRGKEYRVLVLGDRVIGALEMIHPFVVGDGVSTIKRLIRDKQQNTKSQTKLDGDLKRFLKQQGVTLRTVLEEGAQVFIKGHSCLAEGGETRDVTELVHEDVKRICVAASKIVGKHLIGIDVICDDISAAQTADSFTVLEINGKPDLYIHYQPTHGKMVNVIKDVLQFIVNSL